MSLQRSTLESARPETCVQRLAAKTSLLESRAADQHRRIEHLPVFKDFSGRLYHLAVSVKTDRHTRSNGEGS